MANPALPRFLWGVKGDQPFQLHMLFNGSFLKTMAIPVLLHMTWDSPFTSPFDIHLIVLGVIEWFVVFGLVPQGLRQIRDEQFHISQANAVKAAAAASGPQLVHPPLPVPGKVAEA